MLVFHSSLIGLVYLSRTQQVLKGVSYLRGKGVCVWGGAGAGAGWGDARSSPTVPLLAKDLILFNPTI